MLLATPIAASVDVEALLWIPRPIIVVPALPLGMAVNNGQFVAAAWEAYVGSAPDDNIFTTRMLLNGV